RRRLQVTWVGEAEDVRFGRDVTDEQSPGLPMRLRLAGGARREEPRDRLARIDRGDRAGRVMCRRSSRKFLLREYQRRQSIRRLTRVAKTERVRRERAQVRDHVVAQ